MPSIAAAALTLPLVRWRVAVMSSVSSSRSVVPTRESYRPNSTAMERNRRRPEGCEEQGRWWGLRYRPFPAASSPPERTSRHVRPLSEALVRVCT